MPGYCYLITYLSVLPECMGTMSMCVPKRPREVVGASGTVVMAVSHHVVLELTLGSLKKTSALLNC